MKKKTGTYRRKWARAFLGALGELGVISRACKAARISRQCAYDERAANAEFARMWDESIETALDALEVAATKRALQKSDRLLMFLLSSKRSNIFGRKQEISLAPEPVEIFVKYADNIVPERSQAERDEIASQIKDETLEVGDPI